MASANGAEIAGTGLGGAVLLRRSAEGPVVPESGHGYASAVCAVGARLVLARDVDPANRPGAGRLHEEVCLTYAEIELYLQCKDEVEGGQPWDARSFAPETVL